MAESEICDGLTIEFVRACFSYDPKTGDIRWKVKPSGRKQQDIGDFAGGASGSAGYIRVQVFGRMFQAHRLAWALHYGEWPGALIDHINGIKTDNSISNLRLASHTQNMRNAASHSSSTSGFKGVDYMKARNCWRARISTPEGDKHIGTFPTNAAAARAYDEAAIQYHGAFARSNFSKENYNV